MLSIRSKLVLGAILLSLLVVLVALVAVTEQLNTAETAAKLEAENLATTLAYSSAGAAQRKDQKALQGYVEGLHAIYRRDTTIVDADKVRIADSDAGDVGNVYQHDRNNEVGLTLKDGRPRYFTEVSPLFPSGTREIVVPIRSDQSKQSSYVIGAVILEYTPIYDELIGVARAKIALIVVAAAACVVLALLASLLIARRITAPISALTRAAADLASGKFDTPVESDRADEIGTLGKAFNEMAAQLQDTQGKLLAHGRDLEAKVAERTAELSERNREIMLFSKINDFLQASDTESEAYRVISQTATQLFPGDSGALYVISASRNMVEANATWGDASPGNIVFPPGDCWALRRGQGHLAAGNEVRCRHVAEDGRMYACLPLVAHGETLGILHLVDGLPAADGTGAERMKDKFRLGKNFAEHIGLAIANLRLREAMRSMSIRDPLTGLFNRRYMEEVLAQELFRAKRHATQLVAVMLDIDHFKKFNDGFGHDGGDAVLRELAAYLKKEVRGSDVVCRYGGEEFMLLLSPTTAEGARRRAEHLREGVKNLSVRHARRSLGPITISVGMAVFPDHASETEALVKAADIALYQAKQAGRDRVVVFAGRADQTSA